MTPELPQWTVLLYDLEEFKCNLGGDWAKIVIKKVLETYVT